MQTKLAKTQMNNISYLKELKNSYSSLEEQKHYMKLLSIFKKNKLKTCKPRKNLSVSPRKRNFVFSDNRSSDLLPKLKVAKQSMPTNFMHKRVINGL